MRQERLGLLEYLFSKVFRIISFDGMDILEVPSMLCLPCYGEERPTSNEQEKRRKPKRIPIPLGLPVHRI